MKYFGRWVLVACLNGLLLVSMACATSQGNSAAQRTLSPDGETTYAYLLMDSATRSADYATAELAANLLLRLDPSEQIAVQAIGIMVFQGDIAQAAALAKENLLLHPESSDLTRILAECYFQQGQIKEATALLLAYLKKHPDAMPIREQLFELWAQNRQFDALITHYTRLPQEKRTVALQFMYAHSLAESGRFAGAKRELVQIAQKKPDIVNVWMGLLHIAQQQDDYAAAAEYYAQCQRITAPDYSWSLRGIAYFLEKGQAQRAFSIVQGFDDLGDAQVPLLLQSVGMFIDAGFYPEAERVLAQMAQFPAVSAEILFYKSYLLYEVKKDVVAAEALLRNMPKDSRLYMDSQRMRIQMLFEMKQSDTAVQIAQEMLQKNPDDAEIILFVSYITLDLGTAAEAIAVIDAGLERNPENVPLLFGKGSILMVANTTNDAEAYALMEQVITLSPNHAQALNNAGYMLAEKNEDLDKALDYIQRALLVEPESGYILDSLAWVHYQMGNMDAAWQAIQQAVARFEAPDPVIWEHYGDIAKAAGKPAQAREGYQRALDDGHKESASIYEKLSGVQ